MPRRRRAGRGYRNGGQAPSRHHENNTQRPPLHEGEVGGKIAQGSLPGFSGKNRRKNPPNSSVSFLKNVTIKNPARHTSCRPFLRGLQWTRPSISTTALP